MNHFAKIIFLLGSIALMTPTLQAKPKKGYICEKVSKTGKHKILKKVKSKKKCQKLGGEWLKSDHEHGDHDHDRSH